MRNWPVGVMVARKRILPIPMPSKTEDEAKLLKRLGSIPRRAANLTPQKQVR